jgi:hypothetical protein
MGEALAAEIDRLVNAGQLVLDEDVGRGPGPSSPPLPSGTGAGSQQPTELRERLPGPKGVLDAGGADPWGVPIGLADVSSTTRGCEYQRS